jgi:tetratricopeptide (TPR) repeat protein
MRLMLTVMMAWLAAASAASAFTCKATVNRTSVPQGSEVVLTVAANGDVGWSPEFQLPDLPGVRIHAGGTNQSMSMVNGRTETSVSRTYYLKVESAADFTIGPVTIVAGKIRCATDPITVKVTAAPDPGQVPPDQTGNRVPATGGFSPPAKATAGKRGDEVFITLDADRNEAWVGEQIVLTFRYWWRVQPWNNPSYTPPGTEGFWREDLGSERKLREVLDGRAYNVTEIRYALFATRVGDLVIGPAELTFPAGVFDQFLRTRRSQQGPSILRTDPVTIKVRDLPQPRPADFSGVVASRVKIISQMDRDSIPRGEAIGLKVVLDADAFLKGFSGLKITAPAAARMHDAGESFRTGVDGDRLNGRITVEKVIVPEREGELVVPPVELVWFDAGAGRFRTERTGVWTVQVTPSDRPLAGSDESGFLRNEVARLGEDLAFIHQVPRSLAGGRGLRVGGWLWWCLLGLPMVLLGTFRFYLNRVLLARRDPAGRRRRGALAAARVRLADHDGDAQSAAARAVCGYVADRENLPLAAVGPVEVRSYCAAIGETELGERLADVLIACDVERYGQTDRRSSADLATAAGRLLETLAAAERRAGGTGGRNAAATLSTIFLGLALVLCATESCVAATVATRPGVDPVRLLAEGNQAYTEGNIDQARRLYLDARDAGVNDPVLHFNLGNAYARTGELGQAVVSYLRAQRLDPRNRDIRGNLVWVRHHLKDLELADEPLPLFIAQAAALIGFLTLSQWGVILVVTVWVLAGLLAWGWYREQVSTGLRRWLLGVASWCLVVAVITAGRWYNEEHREEAVVVVAQAAVRSGPAGNFATLFEVHDGLTLNIVGRREGWVRVGLGGTWQGWLPAESVEPVRRPDS